MESRAGGGASFFVELPVAGTVTPDPPASLGRKTPIEVVGGASILVVEDEKALAAAVSDSLRDAGYVVEHAADGEQALLRVAARAFDLVVCDLKMPRLDGKAFFRKLETTSPQLAKRVIFVTGDVAGTDAEKFLDESGCRWLAKPFRLGELLRVVKECLS